MVTKSRVSAGHFDLKDRSVEDVEEVDENSRLIKRLCNRKTGCVSNTVLNYKATCHSYVHINKICSYFHLFGCMLAV